MISAHVSMCSASVHLFMCCVLDGRCGGDYEESL